MTVSTPDAEQLYDKLAQWVATINTGGLRLVGVISGGLWLARRLQSDMGMLPVGALSSAMHRDDFARRGLARSEQTRMPFEVTGADVLLLDDVLHTGRTIRAALNELFDYGRPARVRLAVLVDRRGRELPFCPDFAASKQDLPPTLSLELQQNEAGIFAFHVERVKTA